MKFPCRSPKPSESSPGACVSGTGGEGAWEGRGTLAQLDSQNQERVEVEKV